MTRYKKDKLEADLKDIEIQIKSFEEKYGLDSDEFISDFKRGEAGDNIDFLEWASLHDMKKRIVDRLTLLEGA